MSLPELNNKLIAVGRANPPSDRVPYAFEKRIMAFITTRPAMDNWAFWSRSLWRAAASCVAIMLVAGAVTFFSSGTASADLSQDFDNTVLAAVDQETDYSR